MSNLSDQVDFQAAGRLFKQKSVALIIISNGAPDPTRKVFERILNWKRRYVFLRTYEVKQSERSLFSQNVGLWLIVYEWQLLNSLLSLINDVYIHNTLAVLGNVNAFININTAFHI